MEFGRFSFARSRSVLAFSLVLLCSSDFKAWAQQAPASIACGEYSAGTAAQPISQAAVGSGTNNADPAKAAANGSVEQSGCRSMQNSRC